MREQLHGCITNAHALSKRKQCELLEINRSSLYYKPLGEKQENLAIMRQIDEHHLKHPADGVLRVQDFLLQNGFVVNHKRVRRLMRKMGLMAIYPKRNLSKQGQAKYSRPYLLRDLLIDHPNQVWAIDITYIPMKKGFMYLTAIIDIYSRYVVGWNVSNTLDAECSLSVLKNAIALYGKPEIVNSDQGSQFTCELWTTYLEEQGIQISMDGKGRALDNIFIERLWRTVKYDYVYLNPANDGIELYEGLKEYFDYYNHRQPHQGIGRQIPVTLFKTAA
ncbi:MAG: IS3 family transposase [Thermoflavifilum aggregans]|nr:IS3 family transposase [Thermoflavifilum aggregans]